MGIAFQKEYSQKDVDKKILVQLLYSIDELARIKTETRKKENFTSMGHIIVLGATSHLDWLDPAIRRPGRFDREIAFGIPTENARYKIIEVLCHKLRMDDNLNYKYLANKTSGFVGADLVSLIKEA